VFSASRRAIAVLASLALLALSAGTTLGASTSSNTALTLTVSSTLSLTGVPAALDFGSGLGGVRKLTPSQASVVADTNLSSGLALNLSFTDLTRTGGTDTIAASNFRLITSGQPSAADCPNAPAGLASSAPVYPGGQWTLCSRNTAGSVAFAGGTLEWSFAIDIPAAAPPGGYTATATWTAVEFGG